MIPTTGTFEEELLSALSETIEGLAFEEVVFEGTLLATSPSLPDSVCAMIAIENPPVGTLGILLPRALMITFTESIHGMMGEEIPQNLLMDNLNELLNTLAGRILSKRLPGNRTFSLGLPVSGVGSFPQVPQPFRLLKYLVGEQFLILLVPESFWSPETWK